jgi:excinuclease ABC subunit B
VIDDPTAKRPALPSPAGRGPARAARRGGESRARKPTLDEMGPGPESAPYRGPRSTMGRPGMRGGFKPKRR